MLEVAILSYNRPTQLRRVLASLPTSSDTTAVYTISDDNSPLHSEILSAYEEYSSKHHNLRLVSRESNYGYDKNLFSALFNSSADYILFISDDDYFLPEALSSLITQSRKLDKLLHIFPYTHQERLYRSYRHHQPTDSTSLNYNSILFSGLCFNVTALKYVPDTEKLFQSVFIQIYLAIYCFAVNSFSYEGTPLVSLAADGENFFGHSSSLLDTDLRHRGSSRSDYMYQKRLLKVVKLADDNFAPGIFSSFLREYNKRLVGLLLRARSEHKIKQYLEDSLNYCAFAPYWVKVIRILVSSLPPSFSSRLYLLLRNFRSSG